MGGPGNDCDLLPGSLEIACGILGHSPLTIDDIHKRYDEYYSGETQDEENE